MSRMHRHRRAGAGGLALLVLLVLAGCAGPRPRSSDPAALAAQQARERAIAAWEQWGFSGRIAISGQDGGGSGRVEWQRQGDRLEVSLQAPVSRQSWRLIATPGAARLEGLEGGPRHGASAERLLREELGWRLPLAAVEAWVRGTRHRPMARMAFDADGRPAQLRESGWTVEYRGWDPAHPELPRRVFAQAGEQRLRLVVDRWQIPEDR